MGSGSSARQLESEKTLNIENADSTREDFLIPNILSTIPEKDEQPQIKAPIANDKAYEDEINTGESTKNNSPVPFPTKGIRLSYIVKDFYDLCGGKKHTKELTTTQVNEQYQMKITEMNKL